MPAVVHSAEWFVVTGNLEGNRTEDCQKVSPWLQREQTRCVGEACRPALSLVGDWLKSCVALAPAGEVQRVRSAKAAIAAKVAESSACSRELVAKLRDGCGEGEVCAHWAQHWATRCGRSHGSPLVVKLIESAVQQAGGGKAKLDLRSCDDLATAVVSASACAAKHRCDEALPKAKVWRTRCVPTDGRPSPGLALAELLVRRGAGEALSRLAVGEGGLAGNLIAPLSLAQGQGAIVTVCDDRVTTLATFLAARRACQGTIEIARVVEGQPRELRLVPVAHGDAAEFSRWLPSLRAVGEREHEDAARLEALGRELTLAAGARSPESQLGLLIKGLSALPSRVTRSPQLLTTLKRHDSTFVAAFTALAKAKQALVNPAWSPLALVAFERRSLALPLADVAEDGLASLGGRAGLSGIDLAVALPDATAAYRASLAPLQRLADARRRKVTPDDELQLDAPIGGLEPRCRDADKKVAQARAALERCGLEGCSLEQVREPGHQLDLAMEAREAVRRQIRFVLASLPNEKMSSLVGTLGICGR